jgi:hypothetical protein
MSRLWTAFCIKSKQNVISNEKKALIDILRSEQFYLAAVA